MKHSLTPETITELAKVVRWWNNMPKFGGVEVEPLKFSLNHVNFEVWDDVVEWEHIE